MTLSLWIISTFVGASYCDYLCVPKKLLRKEWKNETALNVWADGTATGTATDTETETETKLRLCCGEMRWWWSLFFLHQSRMNRIFHSFMKFNQLFGGFIYNAVHLQIIFEPFQCGYLLHTHTIRSVMLWIYSLIEYNGNNENQS